MSDPTERLVSMRTDVDERGAAARLTPALVLEALSLVREGRVFDLSHPISDESPTYVGYMSPPYTFCMWSHPLISRHELEQLGFTNAIGFADERVEMGMHIGTHVDALGHVSKGDAVFGGIPILDAVGNRGLSRLGIEHLPPVVTRGVLFDIPALLGQELAPGMAITPEHLEAAQSRQGVEVREADVVLVRTGWGRYHIVDNARYVGIAPDGEQGFAPGLGMAAAQWLSARRVLAVGSDTMEVEVVPAESPDECDPVHQHLLAEEGVYLIENAALEEIAQAEVSEFLLLLLAPPFKGATGAPLRLTAIA